jgi:DNA-binding MarR family transcriptional regulator
MVKGMNQAAKVPTRTPQVGALLRMAWELLQAELYDGLQHAGFDDLRPAHRPLLRYPPIDGVRPTELAARLRLSKQATNDLLRDMEQMGYVRLEHDPTDGRARIIRYTERGWSLFDIGAQISRDVGQRWAQKVGRREYTQMVNTLEAIIALPTERASV